MNVAKETCLWFLDTHNFQVALFDLLSPSPAAAVNPHNYHITIPQNSTTQANSPFVEKEGPAVPISTSAILANIPAPVFSAVNAKTTVAPTQQQKTKPASTTSTTSILDSWIRGSSQLTR